MWHKIQHHFGWYSGKVETWYADDGWLMVGFKCSQCNKISMADKAYPRYNKITGFSDPLPKR